MRFFYSILLVMAEFDVAIGLATGRGPDYIEADREAVRRWEKELLMLELNR